MASLRAMPLLLLAGLPLSSRAGLPKIDPKTITNIGMGIWDIVKDSKVTAEVGNISTSASGVPQGITAWTDMAGWTPSKEQHRYSFKMHDPMHIPFLEYDYSVSFMHSGSYNGTGAYLAEVRLVPEKVWLNLGAGSLNAEVEIRDVLNAGTAAAPVAGIEVVHRFTQKNWFQTNVHEDVFFVKGTGELVCQSGPSCDGKAGGLLVV